ncbi:MAG: hypothetical protein HY906_07320 [Deltaproteobacteria bacterium]|nr:hypothetical protein [Deltaproteobacteria bacterium]
MPSTEGPTPGYGSMGKNHDGVGPAHASWSKGVYTGQAGQTRLESLHYSCPCGAVFPARVYRVVNATRDPEPGERLRSGTLNQVTCPSCGHVGEAQVSVIYHDEDERRFALMLPESGRTREMWERAELMRLVAEDPSAPVPDYVKQPEVVFGLEGLLIWLESEGRLTTATTSLEAIAREQALEERSRDLDEREAAVAGREGALAQQKREVADARAEQGRQRHDLEARADELAKRERSLLRREEAATRRDAELNDRESRLRERETRLGAREGELDALEDRLRDHAAEQEHTGKVPRTTPPPPRSRRQAAGEPEAEAEPEAAEEAEPSPASARPRRTTLVMPTVAPAPPAEAEGAEEEPTPLPQPGPPELDDEPEPSADLPPVRLAPPPAPSPQQLLPGFGEEGLDRTVRGPAPTGRQDRGQPVVVRRWLESGERTLACVVQGIPYLAATMSPRETAPFAGAEELQVLVQLHRLPTYPLVALVVLAGPPEDRERFALGFPLDFVGSSDRAVLDGLASEFRLVLDLYGVDRAPTLSRELRAPLAENVRYLLSLAEEHQKTVPTPQRSFADARLTYLADSFDRLGKKATAFTEDSFSLIPGPAAARVAVNVVDFWSDRENEDYLVLQRSFPLPWWRRIRTRVLNAALEHGIALSQRLQTLALAQGLAQSRRDLWTRVLKAASEVLQRQRVNDLDPEAETDNWAAIVRECDAAQVSVERRVLELVDGLQARIAPRPITRTMPGLPALGAPGPLAPQAAAPPPPPPPPPPPTPEPAATAAEGAAPVVTAAVAHPGRTAPTELPPDQDFSDRPVAELLRELDRKDGRKDAALELCRRGDRQHLPALFAAVRRMTRSEAIRVLPALVRFGAAAEPLFVEGLEARKSFLRQGCALALGSMKAAESTDGLVKLLIEEPTEIWREVARALGDIGRASVMSLAARIREADAEGRERITVALAHVAARGHQAPVEALAGGRDSSASQCAQRALERADDIKQQDDEVRGERSEAPRETTMVRSFTRHFFESLQGEEKVTPDVVELDASELVMEEEEQAEEELGDEDILEEGDAGGEPSARRRGRGSRRGPRMDN